MVRDQCQQLLHQWKDSRLVWLPLQLALSPEDYASQDQIDALIARAVGHSFSDRNALRYLRTADLPLEIARSILAARRYHVLWTHDFTGRRDTGALDDIAYTIVADVYLPALTAAVARYDSTGSMPQYFILLDAFYYHGRAGDLWMSILDNPLRATVRLPPSATHGLDQSRLRSARAPKDDLDGSERRCVRNRGPPNDRACRLIAPAFENRKALGTRRWNQVWLRCQNHARGNWCVPVYARAKDPGSGLGALRRPDAAVRGHEDQAGLVHGGVIPQLFVRAL